MNYTLYQLNNLVRETLERSLDQLYWVEAELSECRESSGHCYMELVQKGIDGNTPVARASAKCWRSTWSGVRPRFERATGQSLHAGMKVLLKVGAQFHEAYGFSWIVYDIDPNYTMGDMARRRQEIINTLKEEGVFDLNRSLAVPMFAQRIAVISSATAAGYGDFCNQLNNNEYGFFFRTRLFPATMQGEQVEESVIAALDGINQCIDDFDVVVIIRGGGGTADLSGFDTLRLAENVANFPLPIITGIGHDRDESVLDMISCQRVKTPTAAADFLIANLLDVLNHINDMGQRIVSHVRQRMDYERERLAHFQAVLPVAVRLKTAREESAINTLNLRLGNAINMRLEKENYRLDILSRRIDALNPVHVLRRGYAIVRHEGKAVKAAGDVTQGDKVTITTANGTIETQVI